MIELGRRGPRAGGALEADRGRDRPPASGWRVCAGPSGRGGRRDAPVAGTEPPDAGASRARGTLGLWLTAPRQPVPTGADKAELDARLRAALPRPPARRLLLLLLPRRQPPRRRGPHRAGLPAGLPPLRARAAGVERPAAAPVAHPHRPQPRLQLPPRPRPQAAVAARQLGPDRRAARDRAHRRGPRGAAST